MNTIEVLYSHFLLVINTTRLRNALQIVMAIEFLPESVFLDSAAEVPSKGFGKKHPTAKLWQIRKVEIEQKRYIVTEKTDGSESESTSKSPRPHFLKMALA